MKSYHALFLLLVAICILLTVFIFQPGYMNADAVDQLGQAHSGIYNDWHPPVMSWLWSWLDKIVPGPMGMFVLQVVLFWISLGMFAALAFQKPINRFLFLLLGFYPPLFMLLSTVVKDVLMTAVFLFGFALILIAGEKRSPVFLLAGMVFLAYGTLTRHNAILAVLPLFLYAGWVFINLYPAFMSRFSVRWRPILAGFAFLGVFLVLGNIWSGSLTKVKSYPFQQIMVHDLTGISLTLKTDFLPDYLASSEQPSMKDLRHIYQTRSVKNLYWPDFTSIHFKILYEPTEVRDLTNTWIATVMKYPRAYLDHRTKVFAATMGVSINKSCGPYYYEETIYKPKGYYQSDGNYYSESKITNSLFTMIEPLRESPLYWNWLYVFSSLLIFISSLTLLFKQSGRQNAIIALVLSASGTLYGLGYFFAATACDFRMVHWNVAVTLISAVFLFLPSAKKESGYLAVLSGSVK
jgi:hypothetical protein